MNELTDETTDQREVVPADFALSHIPLTRPRVPKASEVLADKIRRHILGNALPAGTRLPSEGDLIRDLAFGRGTVREALRLLESEGLIEIGRGARGGVVVAEPDSRHTTMALTTLLAVSQTSLRDLFELRYHFEPLIARMAAERASETEKSALVASAACGLHEVSEFGDFHTLLSGLSGNALMSTLFNSIGDIIRNNVSHEPWSEADLDETAHAHSRIAQAIAEGVPADAQRFMEEHITYFQTKFAELGRLDQPIVDRSKW